MESWQEETVFHDGDRFFSRLCNDIACARTSIDLETYIFDRDPLGERILLLLSRAARRGVRVRLMLDGVGCSNWSYADLGPLLESGAQARFFHPLPWQDSRLWRWRFPTLRRIALGLGKLNRRNHRKTCVLDGTIAFLGGMNISGRHTAAQSGSSAWRDTSVRVLGPAVQELSHAFERTWLHSRSLRQRWWRDRRHPAHPVPLQIGFNRRQRRAFYLDLVCRVVAAKTRVWITNPYFVPEVSLLRALRFPAWSGTDVRLLVPRQSDVWGMRWAVKASYFILLNAGVRIFEYDPSILHAKSVIIDDWVKVGSSNLNRRSLLRDLEVDVILSRPESLASMTEQFLADVERSLEIRLSAWNRRSWTNRLLEGLAVLFRRWL